jgi:multidrug resistance protein MdtO
VPNGHWLIVTIFIVSQPNVGASIDKAILRLVGTLVGATGVILTVVAFPQQPWFFLPLLALLIGGSAFLARTTSYPYVAMLGGITIVLFLATEAEHPATSVTDGLWRLAVIALAEVIATSAQLLLWPDDPEQLLLDDFVAILRAVEQRLDRLVAATAALPPTGAESARLRDGVFNGLARHLDLLGNAETRYRRLRQRHAEQLVLIGAVNRVATASLTLETLLAADPVRFADADPDDPLRARIAVLSRAVATLRSAIAERRVPGSGELELPGAPAAPSVRDLPLLPPLVDMQRALGEMRPALVFLDRGARADGSRGPLTSFLDETDAGRFFTPACSLSNTRDLRYAAQVTLAAMTCYLIVTGLRWPGIFTAVVTCVIVGQSSFGATVQKAGLRLAGAVVGGLLALLAILLVMPNIDTLPPFLIVIGACAAVAAYVVSGSARISYVGIQIALAFAMALLDTFGPSIELVRPRDRVLGILLGNVVTAAVMFWVWPVLAGEDMVRTLESALRQMAMLSRVAISGGVGEQVVRPVHGFRVQIFQDLASTMRMHGEAQFEPGAASPEHKAQQQRLLGLLQDAQQVFLIVAGFVRNRLNVALPQIDSPARQQVHEVAVAVGASLDAAADRLAGRTPREAPSLRALVDAAESDLTHTSAVTREPSAAAGSVADLRAQLELYRSLVPLIEGLTSHADAVHASLVRSRPLASP